MFIIFDLIFLVFSIFLLPVYLLRKKFHSGFLLRLGILPKGLNLKNPIWIHAVSVGEVMAIKGLLTRLRKEYPDEKFVISTVTPTGNKIAKNISEEGDFVTYLPLDLSFIVRRTIDRINPRAFIIAETEIWPNLIRYIAKKNIPIITVNGRISDSSFKGYSFIKVLIRPILAKIKMFCVQTERDAERLKSLGVEKSKINITGNMKFDLEVNIDEKKRLELRKKIGLKENELLLVCGSTHLGEEELILGIYKELQRDFPLLKLLIAPRHPERSNEVEKIISSFGFHGIFISKLVFICDNCIPKPVFILDTVGELMSYYLAADIVFVGGSLIKKGGHNILEPASQGKPILIGPHMFNFRDITELFLSNNAALMVHNQQDLKSAIEELSNNPCKAIELGKNALQLILKNQGATEKNVRLLKQYL